ncbi:hypothetical protein JJD26997_1989 [Campylobacter jejuni subsp. doylei 269.97]|uniref:Uncharacterized protein n=1 Tax=Campylobacter jejuni subsp. doylei (strain ATCC BAA-1458 / RM4099 / 269.97) TaxID=360109 RepID=A7H5X8_CAMJD|nr:hypothetical protein JJD26997_1989 [Campylobacter jejuni subsp. doylei 269.97]
MKTLFLNHKYQASYITFIVFIPLLFIIFRSNDFFKIEIRRRFFFFGNKTIYPNQSNQ